jgi:hypothetical protein
MRYWHKGHCWHVCKSRKCNVCGNPIPNSKFCYKWEPHTKPGTTWIHSSLYKKLEDKKDMVPGTPAMMDENLQLTTARQALKQTRKFLKATVKLAKK